VALIAVAAIALIAVFICPLIFTHSTFGADDPQPNVAPKTNGYPAPSGCASVRASTYNQLLKVRGSITGHKQRFRHSPVCRTTFGDLKRSTRAARKKCKAHAITSGASFYGGPSDASSGSQGAYGPLSGTRSFAELDMGTGLGGLPPRSWWFLHHVSRTVHAQKLDIGAGGGPIQGVHRGIDLWHETLGPLGLSDNAVIQIAKHNCWAKTRGHGK
jgi:hypothetical protein